MAGGLLFGEVEIPGLVLDPIEWGEWEFQLQLTKVSGLQGQTGLNTSRGGRLISFDMIIQNGFSTHVELFDTLSGINTLVGTEDDLSVFDPADVLQYRLEKCVLLTLRIIKHRSDAVHGFWARVQVMFRQMSPPADPSEDEDEETDDE